MAKKDEIRQDWDSFFKSDKHVSEDFMTDREELLDQERESFDDDKNLAIGYEQALKDEGISSKELKRKLSLGEAQLDQGEGTDGDEFMQDMIDNKEK